jgi:hypothetical protein
MIFLNTRLFGIFVALTSYRKMVVVLRLMLNGECSVLASKTACQANSDGSSPNYR